MAAQNYTLRFKNRSNSQHDFLCYQQGISVNQPGVYTLAWFAKPVANGVDVDFTWSIDYSFVWSEQGTLKPGITFLAQQSIDADLQTDNFVDFTQIGGAFQFANENGSGAAGSLTIDCDGTIPKSVAMIGVGMSGQGTHVVAAEPNFAAVFTPHPEYWISFGSYLPGQVIDVQTMVNSDQVTFPANVYEMTATLDSGNNWTLAQGLV
jgi:hypothetical protein